MYKKYYIGVDIGGTNVKFGLFGSNDGKSKKLLKKYSFKTYYEKENAEKRFIENIHDAIEEFCDNNSYGLNKKNLVGIGYAFPGPVVDNVVIKAVNINWKKKYDIVKATKKRFGKDIKVCVLNDANAAAIGEYNYGLKKKYKSICFITLGTAVGAGIIIDGKLVEGKNGAAGELGHIRVDFSKDALKCNCGKAGCLEVVASGRGIAKVYNMIYHTNIMTEAKEVIDRAKKSDEKALKSLDISLNYLSMIIAVLIHTLDPEIVLIGGGVSHSGQIIIDIIKRNLNGRVCIIDKMPKILLAKLKNDAGLYGVVVNI